MDIDFSGHSVDELRELNHGLVEHIKLTQQRASQDSMNKFKLDELVCFENQYGEVIEGKIIRFNQKTVTIEKDCGHQWRVPPQFLSRVFRAQESKQNIVPVNIFDLSPEQLKKDPQTSKNAPCPCGSGRKYKRCCFNKTAQVLN